MAEIERTVRDWLTGLWPEGSAAATTVIGVMDRDDWTARTDIVVVADARRRRLVWIPRDLWCDVVGDRINEAYARGGHELLRAAMREIGLPTEGSVVLLRSAVERAVSELRVTVPVERARRYWYPMSPTSRLEDGAKLVAFEPPQETLSGERIHQWIGARKSAETPAPRLPDLDRIERQQILIQRLLQEGFDFAKTLDDPARVAVSDARALAQLAAVRPDWALRTFSRVEPTTIDGKQVLTRRYRLFRCGAPRGGR
jgi:anionic cell wall polymer biosynthesis LytR-Cps2A-Psr (LCP) family protein